MDPVIAIALWATLFVASHIVISSDAVRPGLIRAIGAMPYRGLYSLVAFATFTPLLLAFAHHKHAGPMLWYLRGVEPIRWLVWLLMLLAFIFFVGSFVNPNPGAIGADAITGTGSRGVHGMLKVTRHPNFVALTIFALAHMLMNGWTGDVIFFGSIAALAIFGGRHQDARKLRELGAPYRALVDETSFFPGAALVSGRQHWTAADTPWVALVLGAVVTAVVMMFHPTLFGGHPLG
ncbi:MAG TPA: NnrU family protein [Candidatus Binataceae bacterium]|nr:NnrU family protein [Candidatus Binataceae bacterium]